MPTYYEIKGALVVVSHEGPFEEEQNEAVLAELLADPALVPASALLIDARKATGNSPRREIAQQADWFASVHRGRFSRCAVISSPGLHFGLTRMFSSFADAAGFEVQVFEEPAPAERWLRNGSTAAGN